MYHIKDDRRSRASADAVVRGLQKCLQTMPLQSITISDLHRASGVSRATFYRLFDTPEDVLHYHFDRMTEDLGTLQEPQVHLEQMISQGMEYHEFVRALIENRRLDLLYEYTEKSFEKMDQKYRLAPPDMGPVERSYFITQLSMSIVAALIAWNRNGRKETPAQIAAYMRRNAEIQSNMVDTKKAADSR